MIHRDYFAEKFNLDLTGALPIKIFKIDRPIMARCLAELGYTVGAEIGVAAGEHSEILLKNIPGLTLYSIDAWEKGDRWPNSWQDEARQRLAPYKNCIIKQQYSVEAAKGFADKSLDFVYIDADHLFKSVADDICAWKPKVKPGGILFGHDFHRSNTCKVLDVVTAYAVSHNLRSWFVLGMGEPDPAHPDFGPQYYEFPPSWMFLL